MLKTGDERFENIYRICFNVKVILFANKTEISNPIHLKSKKITNNRTIN